MIGIVYIVIGIIIFLCDIFFINSFLLGLIIGIISGRFIYSGIKSIWK